MKKEAYLAGAYRPGTSRYRMAVRKYGPLPAPVAAVEAPKAPVVEEKAEEAPKVKKKVVKKAAKKKTEE
jgi:hypothetical protein